MAVPFAMSTWWKGQVNSLGLFYKGTNPIREGSALMTQSHPKGHISKYHHLGELGFSDGSHGKESACSAGDPNSIPDSGRSPGEGNSNLLQYSCLENPMDRGTWQATVHGVAKSQTRLSD